MQDFRTHPEWQALVSAVAAARRGDALPRLVAADWLDEHGRAEYAAFLRHGINPGDYPIPEGVRGGASEPSWLNLFRRVLELEERYGVVTEWEAGRVVAADVPWPDLSVCRLLADLSPRVGRYGLGLCTADPIYRGYGWAWAELKSALMPDSLGNMLPPPVFARLTLGESGDYDEVVYEDEKSARAALSRALRAISHQ